MIGNIEQASFYMQLREILREKIETEESAAWSKRQQCGMGSVFQD